MKLQKIIFFMSLKDLDFDYFENNEINFKVQQTSNDTYLKADKLKGKIIDNYDILENTFNLSLYSNDLSINFDTAVYEDLSKKDSSDKYEYILPKLSLIKKIIIIIIMEILLSNLKQQLEITIQISTKAI